MSVLLLTLSGLAAGADELQNEKADPATDTPVATPADIYPPARSLPPSFEYAQCANACQIERDRLLSVCNVPDNPNRPQYDKPLNCSSDNTKEFAACLAMCPIDTGEEATP
jgi:hypothetical protein